MKFSILTSFCRVAIKSLLVCLLAIQIVFLVCFISYGELPIPNFLANKLLLKISPEGALIQGDRLTITPQGQFRLSGLQLTADDFESPLMEAQSASIKLKLYHSNGSFISLDKIVISGGTLHLPASIAPNGKASSILEKIAFSLVFLPDQLHVASFAAMHAQVRLRGDAVFPLTKFEATEATDSDQAALIDRIPYELIKTIITEIDRYTFLYNPTLAFDLKVDSEKSVSLKTKISSRSIEHPLFQGSDFRLETSLKYTNGALIAEAPVLLKLKDFAYPDQSIQATSVSAYIAKENWNDLIQKKWPVFELAAEQIDLGSYRLDNPYIQITSNELPLFSFKGASSFLDNQFLFTGALDYKNLSGHLSTAGHFDLLTVIPEPIREKLPELNYQTPPYLNGNASFGPNFTLEEANFDLTCLDLKLKDLDFNYIEAHLQYDGLIYRITDSLIQRNSQWVELGFSFDPTTFDYRVSLVGSAVPYEYNAILPDWWSGIFKDFKFSESTKSLGDFIIYGKTNRPVADLFFGHVYATDVSYKDVPVDAGTLFVRGRQRYVEIDRIDVVNTTGWTKGKVSFSSLDDAIRAPISIRYQIEGAILPSHAANIFGGGVAEILADFEMAQAPNVNLSGAYFNTDYPALVEKSFFILIAETRNPFTYRDAKLDHLKLNLTTVQNNTYLREIEFGFAEGIGQAKVDIINRPETTPKLNFTLNLVAADKNKTFRNLPFLPKDNSSENSANASYDLQLSAVGPIDQPEAFLGNGILNFRSKSMGAIQLFGPLSKILQNTKLGFTSLGLESLDAYFGVKGSVLDFEKIEINGPQTRIFAQGSLVFPEQSLDMEVSLNLFANWVEQDSGLKRVSEVLNPFLRPLPNLLRFNLGGTLDDQNWRSLYDPRNLFK
jgi:hypothetical protein